MESKSHDKYKHKKSKKEKHKNKSKKKRKESTSESESESEEEWVESTRQEKSMRDDWMKSDAGSFDDFVPTYSKNERGGERKRQRLKKTEAEKMLEKKLLEERELNPYLKNSGSSLRMMRPGDDNDVKSHNTTVGDGGYGWLKKAYERVKEQAAEEGRTMDEVAVERWGSLEKLEKMLYDAKQRSRGGERSRSRSPRRHDRKYNKHRSNERSHHDVSSSSSSESKRNKYNDSYTSKSHYDSYSKSSRRSSYDKHDKDSDSLDDTKQFLSPSNDHWPSWKKRKDDSYGDKSKSSQKYDIHSRSSSSSHPAWKKKVHEEDSSSQKCTVPSDEGSSHADRKVSEDKTISSSSNRSHQPAWKKKSDSAFLQNRFAKEGEEGDHEKKLVPISISESHLEEVEEKEDSETQKDDEISDDSDTEIARKKESMKDIIMNRNEISFLAGRAIRAEIFGDYKLAGEIREALVLAEAAIENLGELGPDFEKEPREEVMDYLIDSYPYPKRLQELYHSKRKTKKEIVQVGPFKKQYFDDELSLKEMFQSEKATTMDDQLRMYVNTAAACKNAVHEDFADDDVSGKVLKKMNTYQQKEEKDIKKAIQDFKRRSNALDKCRYCLDKPLLLKHTIVAKGNHVIICVPPFTSLTEGHCFIIPKAHVSSSLHLEENEFNELQIFKRGLARMFGDENFDVIFMETSIHHRHFPHTVIECIPVQKETADMAPMYFKKAIDECEMEWSQNKKLIDLAKKGFRHSVPKGLPFFAVEFSFGGGFAHIIEDEKNFPKHFGKEIIGGMLEIDSHLILKAKDESVEDLCKKTLKLIEKWWNYKNFFES